MKIALIGGSGLYDFEGIEYNNKTKRFEYFIMPKLTTCWSFYNNSILAFEKKVREMIISSSAADK